MLWAYRTTPRRPTGESTFSLVYGAEAVLPTEVDALTSRSLLSEDQNDELLFVCLDRIEEKRSKAAVRLQAYHQQLRRSYGRKVRARAFQAGDLVWRKMTPNKKNPAFGKL